MSSCGVCYEMFNNSQSFCSLLGVRAHSTLRNIELCVCCTINMLMSIYENAQCIMEFTQFKCIVTNEIFDLHTEKNLRVPDWFIQFEGT